MRNNQPVTQREYGFAADATLMSTTDTKGKIVYTNDAFVEVSGFTRADLDGQPHNIIRHPDMPPSAFGDMWATLKGGEPWTAIVKNRRRDGDHYWVRANAVPIVRQGRQLGFMSVRTHATPAESEAAEQLYGAMRAGRARGRKLHKGVLVRTGLGAALTWGRTMGVRTRIRLLIGLMGLLCVLGAATIRKLGGDGGMVLLWVLAVSVLIGALLERQIARPLEHAKSVALRVASGDYQEASRMERVDEVGMTLRAISQLGLMFRWIVDDVAGQVANVQSAMREIAQGNTDLSNRTERAAASLAETAASMHQVNETVRQNADTAARAKELSGHATASATRGGNAVGEVTATMGEISASSSKIADIISVIDGIAFQTNILALNASVEAARAGEQGRGFAVVAGEVRTLAQRSAQAAKEIKALIEESADKVAAGTRLVNAAGQAMGDIVSQVKQVSGLIESISSATSAQAAEVAQVSERIAHFDDITQQNAALVEQATAATASLYQQVSLLTESVRVFR